MTSDATAEEIRRQMARVRQHLQQDVDEICQGAGRMTDWRNYVAAYPWISLGTAAALGFLIVPSKVEIVSPDAETLGRLTQSHRLAVQGNPATVPRPRLAETAFRWASHVLLRAGITYLGRQVGRPAVRQSADETAEENSHE